ncbi:MAG: arsenate reductase family protein [Longimicrobiales bacterium]
MEIQIFGTKKCTDTRKALRFFSERRVRTHFVDLKQKAASVGELRRFVQKFGVDGVMDRESKRSLSLGLHQAGYSPERWIEILAEEPLTLRTPLVRWRHRLTIGHAAETWKAWMEEA